MPPLHATLLLPTTTIDTPPTTTKSTFTTLQQRLLNTDTKTTTMPAATATTSLYDSYFGSSSSSSAATIRGRECPSEDIDDFDDGCNLPSLPYWQQYEDTRGGDNDRDSDDEDDEFLFQETGEGKHHQQPPKESTQAPPKGFSSRPLESSCWDMETGINNIRLNNNQTSSSEQHKVVKRVRFSISKPQVKIIPRVDLQEYQSLYYGANELQQMHNESRKLRMRAVHFSVDEPQIRDIPKVPLRDHPVLYYGVCELQSMIDDYRREQQKEQQEQNQEKKEEDEEERDNVSSSSSSTGIKFYLLHVNKI